MTGLLVRGIGELVTNDPRLGDGSPLGLLHDAALVVERGLVAWIGAGADAPAADRVVDGRVVVRDGRHHLVDDVPRALSGAIAAVWS